MCDGRLNVYTVGCLSGLVSSITLFNLKISTPAYTIMNGNGGISTEYHV